MSEESINAGTKNMIPLTERPEEEARALRMKGSKAKTPQKRFSALIEQSKKAKCKNCRAQCILKESNLEQEKGMVCPIPEARAKAIFYSKPVVDEGILDKLGHTTLFTMLKIANENKNFNMIEKVHKAIILQKEVDYPKVQKNLNLNVNEGEITIRWVGMNKEENKKEDVKDDKN